MSDGGQNYQSAVEAVLPKANFYGTKKHNGKNIRLNLSQWKKTIYCGTWFWSAQWNQNKSMCCPWQSSEARCILEEPVDWADGFVVVYNISDRTSFINAKNILRQIREARMDNCKGSEAQWGCFILKWVWQWTGADVGSVQLLLQTYSRNFELDEVTWTVSFRGEAVFANIFSDLWLT